MTRNQLQFHANQEIARANRVREALDTSKHELDQTKHRDTHAENVRHNRKAEQLSKYAADQKLWGDALKAFGSVGSTALKIAAL